MLRFLSSPWAPSHQNLRFKILETSEHLYVHLETSAKKGFCSTQHRKHLAKVAPVFWYCYFSLVLISIFFLIFPIFFSGTSKPSQENSSKTKDISSSSGWNCQSALSHRIVSFGLINPSLSGRWCSPIKIWWCNIIIIVYLLGWKKGSKISQLKEGNLKFGLSAGRWYSCFVIQSSPCFSFHLHTLDLLDSSWEQKGKRSTWSKERRNWNYLFFERI